MITLKLQILENPNWLEATWVEKTQLPGMDVPASESQVWCQSYHPTQIDLLRAKAAEYGTPLDEYEPLLADWVAAYTSPPPPPIPVPQQVTMRQARLELLGRDLLDDVEAVISAAGRAAQIEWEYAAVVERSNPAVAIVQAQQGLTDEQVDDLFREAAKR